MRSLMIVLSFALFAFPANAGQEWLFGDGGDLRLSVETPSELASAEIPVEFLIATMAKKKDEACVSVGQERLKQADTRICFDLGDPATTLITRVLGIQSTTGSLFKILSRRDTLPEMDFTHKLVDKVSVEPGRESGTLVVADFIIHHEELEMLFGKQAQQANFKPLR